MLRRVARTIVPPVMKPAVVTAVDFLVPRLRSFAQVSSDASSKVLRFFSEASAELRKPGWGDYRKVAPNPWYVHPVFLAFELDKRISTAWRKAAGEG
jgi:hypothetical protein